MRDGRVRGSLNDNRNGIRKRWKIKGRLSKVGPDPVHELVAHDAWDGPLVGGARENAIQKLAGELTHARSDRKFTNYVKHATHGENPAVVRPVVLLGPAGGIGHIG